MAFVQERSSSSSCSSTGAVRTCPGTSQATRELLEAKLNWRRSTGVTEGQIRGGRSEQIARLKQLIRTFPTLFDAVPGQRREGQGRCYTKEASPVGAVARGKRSGEEKKKQEKGGFRERETGEERESYERKKN